MQNSRTVKQDGPTKIEAMIDAIFIRPDLNREFYLVYCDMISHAARLDNFSAVATTFHGTAHQMYADVVAMGIQAGVFPGRDPNAAGAELAYMMFCGEAGYGSLPVSRYTA